MPPSNTDPEVKILSWDVKGEDERYTLPCSCRSEVIVLSTDNDFVTVSTYRQNYHRPILTRLRHIWHIIRYGHPYNDDVCISPVELIRLRHYLNTSKAVQKAIDVMHYTEDDIAEILSKNIPNQ